MDKEKEEELKLCTQLSTYPQFGGTCWLNAILMAIFYSQNSRKLLLNIVGTWDNEKNKNNKFLKICKKILLNYYIFTDKANTFFNKFKPEVIIYYMLHYYKHDDLNRKFRISIKKDGYSYIGYYGHYIINFYRNLGIKCLDVTYTKDNEFLLNIYKNLNYIYKDKKYVPNTNFSKLDFFTEETEIRQILADIPDVIVFNHYELSQKITDDLYDINKSINTIDALSDIYLSTSHNIEIENLDTYQDEIKFKGETYRLESCLLNSYNTVDNDDSTHIIAGITCKKKRFIYNGWEKYKTEEEKQKYGNTIIACPLIEFNWDLHNDEEFCFNRNDCGILQDGIPRKFCFSFNKLYNTSLIYIRVNNENKSKDININTKDGEPLLSLKPDFAPLVKNMHQIKLLSTEDLIKQLAIFKYSVKKDKKNTRKYLEKILYKKLSKYFNHPINRSSTNPEVPKVPENNKRKHPEEYKGGKRKLKVVNQIKNYIKLDMVDFFEKLSDSDFLSNKLTHVYLIGNIDNKLIDKLIEDIRIANKLPKPKPILIHISSLGGSIQDGMRLLSIYKLSTVPIATIIDNYSFSAATFLSINSQYRLMTVDSYCLIHQYSVTGYMNHEQKFLYDITERYNTYFKAIIDMYLSKTKFTKNELMKLLEHNIILDYKTCLKKGIVDRVINFNYLKKISDININNLIKNKDTTNIQLSCELDIKTIDATIIKINNHKHKNPCLIYTTYFNCNSDDKETTYDKDFTQHKSIMPIYTPLKLISRIKNINTEKYAIIDSALSIENILPLLYTNKIYMYNHAFIICNLLYAFDNFSPLLDDNIKNTYLIINNIKHILKAKTKMSDNDIKNINKKFIILDAKKSLELGLCHEILYA